MSLDLATMHGYQQAFMVSAILMVVALGVAIFVIRTPKTEAVPETVVDFIEEGEEYANSYLERRNTDSLRQAG